MSDAASLAEYPKTIVLPDGAHLVLRPMAAADRPALRALLARLPDDERRRVPDPLAAVSSASDPVPSDASGLLVVLAVDGERVAAVAALERAANPGPRHLAEVALVLDPACRGRRLGTWMLLDCVHLAGGLGVERLVASVAEGEHEYLAALHRLDFVEDASATGGRRAPDGDVRTTRIMAKTLHRGWTDF